MSCLCDLLGSCGPIPFSQLSFFPWKMADHFEAWVPFLVERDESSSRERKANNLGSHTPMYMYIHVLYLHHWRSVYKSIHLCVQ